MTWSDSSSNDVIGYYVYENGMKIGIIRDDSSNSFTSVAAHTPSRAVDITGRLSNVSNSSHD